MTIVLVEHKIDEVVHWVDRVLSMEEGRVVLDAPPHKAFEDIQYWNDLGVSAATADLSALGKPGLICQCCL